MPSLNMKKMVGVPLVSVALLGAQLSPAYAAMVDSPTVLQQAQQKMDRAGLATLLDRQDVRDQLVAMGVDPAAARERVAAMTDEEVRQLNQGIQEMPAGGDVLGFVLAVFIILVITDMLGATDVFSFVHNINK
ncbi:DUF6627 family protein [Thiofaba sp. EF100]|uniref:DUF6627 family protein n=1 Tax=Thiofaba sp. EF100 TaxID=3121274 RepID=UPI0032218FD7